MNIPHIALMKNAALLSLIAISAIYPFGPQSPLLFVALAPAFVFASGFLLELSRERKAETFPIVLFKRAKRLLMPWFFTTILWLVPTYWLFDLPALNRPLHASLEETYRAGLLGLFTGHLWFLPMLFWVTTFWLALLPLERGRVKIGAAIAVLAAIFMDDLGKGLVWYCLWQITPYLIYFYLGIVLCRHRDNVDLTIMARPLHVLAAFVLLTVAAAFSAGLPPRLGWILSCAWCCAAYGTCMLAAECFSSAFVQNKLYVFFERRAFLYYLFHMPTAMLIFLLLKMLNKFVAITPALHICLSLVLAFAATTGLVLGFEVLRGKFREVMDENPWGEWRGWRI